MLNMHEALISIPSLPNKQTNKNKPTTKIHNSQQELIPACSPLGQIFLALVKRLFLQRPTPFLSGFSLW
jgi:hypothetical protein